MQNTWLDFELECWMVTVFWHPVTCVVPYQLDEYWISNMNPVLLTGVPVLCMFIHVYLSAISVFLPKLLVQKWRGFWSRVVYLFAVLDKQATDQNAAAWAAYYAQYYNQPGQQSGGQPGQQPGQPQQPAAPQAASPQQGPGGQQPGQQSNFSTAPCGCLSDCLWQAPMMGSYIQILISVSQRKLNGLLWNLYRFSCRS